MARHLFKVIVLLIPSLATVGLLSYCLFSNLWITVDPIRLHNVSTIYQSQYELIKNGSKIISFSTGTSRIDETRSSLKEESTTTPEAKVQEVVEPEQSTDDADYSAGEEDGGDYATDESAQQTRRRKRRQTISSNFVYITKLMPLTRYKSLYSECTQYYPFKLKMSKSYLLREKKEPIIGIIDYLENFDLERSTNNCDETKQQIKCYLSGKCVSGTRCNGISDCDDQTDEQLCGGEGVCKLKSDAGGLRCDNRCWPYWTKCDQIPHCLDMSDELNPECAQPLHLTLKSFSSIDHISNLTTQIIRHDPFSFTFGSNHFDSGDKCFKTYFNFKSARMIHKENLKYLNQQLADNIQEMNNINYQLQLIYTLSFVFALFFAIMALFSLSFLSCFKKLCFQCPFWFYGFFQILCWLSCLVGLMTFFYQYYNNKQRSIDPSVQLPIHIELMHLNPELGTIEVLGISFWLAVGATGASFLASLFSCLVCCRLPSSRHEDKEYKIMQLPSYN